MARQNISYQRFVFRRFAAKNRRRWTRHKPPGSGSLLLEAADAIDRANAIVSTLDSSDDQALLATPLDEISSALHFELLQKLYLRYPGLAEEGEGWDGAAA